MCHLTAEQRCLCKYFFLSETFSKVGEKNREMGGCESGLEKGRVDRYAVMWPLMLGPGLGVGAWFQQILSVFDQLCLSHS